MTGLAAGLGVVADPDLAEEVDGDGVEREVLAVEEVQHPWITRSMGIKAFTVGFQDAEYTSIDECGYCLPLMRGNGGKVSTPAALES